MVATAEMVPITEARTRIRELIDRLEGRERPIVLVRRSRPAGVLLSPEGYQALLDRLESLEDQISVLWAQLHPEERVSHEKLKAELGI